MEIIPKLQKGNAIRVESDKKVPKYNRAVYSTFDATWDVPKWYHAMGKGIVATYKKITNPDKMDYAVTDSVADAGWRKRLGLSYDSKFLPSNKDKSVRLPKKVEAEIPTDTILLKNRIANQRKVANSPSVMGENWKHLNTLINVDQKTLEALRKTYKTGRPVTINEYSNNSRESVKNGKIVDKAFDYKSPLNVLKNFTVQYNPKNRTMEYKDTYDFNSYERFVPGKPFNIKGEIKLDKK